MNTVIIGMGALGLLFGDMISSNAVRENTVFLMDKDRYERHSKDIYRINGKEKTFRLASADIPGSVPFETADLVIIATKYNGLDDAVSMMKQYTDDNTVIISLLNGIISEDIISQTYNRDNIRHAMWNKFMITFNAAGCGSKKIFRGGAFCRNSIETCSKTRYRYTRQ